MLEILIPLFVVAVLAVAGALAWRLLRGPARSRWDTAGRLAAVALLSGLLVGWGSWRLMKATSSQLLGPLISRVETEERVVALTFDDGPTAQYTDEVLTILRQEGIKATFFVVGAALERDLAVCRRITAKGHELGNHSFSHQRLVLQPYSTIRQEIERTDALIRDCGYEGEIHFRPPGGKKYLLLPLYLAVTGRNDILWDIGPEGDRQVAADPERIVEYVQQRARPGSIVLLHVMYRSRENSRQALPGIIQGLREKGYRFVTVSELLTYREGEN